jgi:phage baseplate assembly protein W
MSRHEENIHESVKTILRTFRGERVMRPEFGAVAEDILFSDLSVEVLTALEEGVQAALEECEPRIANVSVSAERENQGELNVEISYLVRTTNNLFSRVYPFYILEGAGES